jgi:hypothetical protein
LIGNKKYSSLNHDSLTYCRIVAGKVFHLNPSPTSSAL